MHIVECSSRIKTTLNKAAITLLF